MENNLYLNKHLDDKNNVFISIGIKSEHGGLIVYLDETDFYEMVDRLKSHPASPIIKRKYNGN